MTVPLNSLVPGDVAVVESIKSPIADRLYELGLTTGGYVECVLRAPFSDPVAYRIRGAVIAIRNRDCEDIIVRRV